MVECLISNEGRTKFFQPVLKEGIEWTTKRRSEPGKLTFQVLQDEILDFSEGSQVRFSESGVPLFLGYVFKRQRSKDRLVSVTAWDQIRYMKNESKRVYSNKTASQLLQMLAEDYYFKLGDVEDTRYVIPRRVEDKKSLLEMMENALDLTLQNTKEMYVLYDDFGKLALKNIGNMKVGSGNSYLMIDAATGQNYEYTTSIDDSTYNKVILLHEDEKSGKRQIYEAKDVKNMERWGILQYYDSVKNGENGQAKADAMLSLYNKKTRKLRLNNVFGDNRVRAGSMIVVYLALDDQKIQNFMLVEECRHVYKESEHWMDLTLRGGEFDG